MPVKACNYLCVHLIFSQITYFPSQFKGSTDGTTRIWEIETGRCLKVWEIGEAARQISWNPVADRPILAVVLYVFFPPPYSILM